MTIKFERIFREANLVSDWLAQFGQKMSKGHDYQVFENELPEALLEKLALDEHDTFRTPADVNAILELVDLEQNTEFRKMVEKGNNLYPVSFHLHY